jgi:hypothetical protein
VEVLQTGTSATDCVQVQLKPDTTYEYANAYVVSTLRRTITI